MSKIISITPTGQWQDLFKLEVRFDNGDFGTAFAKSQTPPYAVGEEVEYTKNEKGTVKIQRPNPYGASTGSSYTPSAPKGNDERSASIIRQVALVTTLGVKQSRCWSPWESQLSSAIMKVHPVSRKSIYVMQMH